MSTTRRQFIGASTGVIGLAATGLARPALAASDPIRIGWMPALTGASSSTGIALNRGTMLAVSEINAHYICDIHPRSTYFKEMAVNRLFPIAVTDLTAATIPYLELRAKSSLATGIEEPFLDAYKGGSFQYLLIAADRV